MRNQSPVIWLTGLSGAGKSTIATGLQEALGARALPAAVLDGDEIRQTLCSDLGYDREGRNENVRRIGMVAELLVRSGVTTIVAAMSPYRSARDCVRSRVATFIEIYVRCPIEVLEIRDTKGLYYRAQRGLVSNITGIDDPYEEPLKPDLIIDTDTETPGASICTVLSYIEPFLLPIMKLGTG